MPPTVTFDPRSLDDTALAALRAFAVKELLPTAGEYATWLVQWCDREQVWRRKPDREYNTWHDLCLPKCIPWTDAQLAEALVATTMLSYVESNERLAHCIDRHVIVLVNEAARRLKKEPLRGTEPYTDAA